MSVDVVDDLVRVYRGAVPQDVSSGAFANDVAYTIAEMMAMAHTEVSRLERNARIGTAVGLFLDEHARDHGLRRQDGETDEQLQARLQRPVQAGTVPSIIESVELIVGDFGAVYLIELPRQSAYFDRDNFFFDRGCRFGGGRGVVIVLIPESADARDSVTDAVRSKVSAGKIWFVEEYT